MAAQIEVKQLIMNAVLAGAHAQRLIDADRRKEAEKVVLDLSSEIDDRTAIYLVGRIVDRN